MYCTQRAYYQIYFRVLILSKALGSAWKSALYSREKNYNYYCLHYKKGLKKQV